MKTSTLRPLLVAAISACALVVFMASSASAAVNATWTGSLPAEMRFQGTLNLKLNGGSPKTCSVNWYQGGLRALNGGGQGLYGPFSPMSYNSGACEGGGELQAMPYGSATYDSGYKLTSNLQGLAAFPKSPYGFFEGVNFTTPFTNGSGATASTITLSETVIGVNGLSKITASGTLEVKRLLGGLLNLTH